ncbi:hypothetical protein CLOP_g24380 [Closterium sp. NIES-67]|nr:hypothetical protein CLOP_g24380 [Closterium sp. NIES-67]
MLFRSYLPGCSLACDQREAYSRDSNQSGSCTGSGRKRTGSCWAAYRRAVSFASFLVLVARSPRVVTLWKAHMDSQSPTFTALVTELGAVRQAEPDCFASMLVQILGRAEQLAELTRIPGLRERVMRDRAQQMPVFFLLGVAMYHAKPIMGIDDSEELGVGR